MGSLQEAELNMIRTGDPEQEFLSRNEDNRWQQRVRGLVLDHTDEHLAGEEEEATALHPYPFICVEIVPSYSIPTGIDANIKHLTFVW
ncbi:hypothetical protein MUK42_14708 [Musa troglodytarum]|uniref:Uncharacterized protein n=1 Tax=Musa troglodytarum TaxID=320322 RepID=A0A9E7ICK8_9LILI|nr:hypothetical protein MUK42_14708 [Musa troglodytarum]